MSSPANLSGPGRENRVEIGSWSAASTWMTKNCEPAKTGNAFEDLARLHSTIGGSRDTELKLLAVSPTSIPSAERVETTVTPVANAPSALRNDRTWSGAIELMERTAEC